MPDEINESEESQTAGSDVTSQKETQEKTEKGEISKDEFDALKADKEKTQGELDTLKATVYSEDYINYQQSKQGAQTQAPQENLEFLSQKELINLVRKERQQDLQHLQMGIVGQQQEVKTTQQIKQAQKDHADFEARRPTLRKIAERIGGGLTAEDACGLDYYYQHRDEILKKSPQPKPTEKPGAGSGVVKKTEFNEKEALEEAAETSGLDELLASRK